MVGGRVFFFSSRRRHTRLVSDWSSDVCSSDLSRWAGAARSSCSAIRAATSRGGRPTCFWIWSATLVEKSPCPASFGGVSSTPFGGAGKPPASSAAWTAAVSWSRITGVAALGALRRSPCSRMVVGRSEVAPAHSSSPSARGRSSRARAASRYRRAVRRRAGGSVPNTNESLATAARDATGLATVYRALDELVDRYALD